MGFNDRMELAAVHAMYFSCGLKIGDDDLLYIDKTNLKADGVYVGYYPKFMGMGTSKNIATKIEVNNGMPTSITRYDKNGNIINVTEL